jgi:hypothetical protein
MCLDHLAVFGSLPAILTPTFESGLSRSLQRMRLVTQRLQVPTVVRIALSRNMGRAVEALCCLFPLVVGVGLEPTIYGGRSG